MFEIDKNIDDRIGVLPFGAMFIELFFIFSAIWENQYYYLFGFLFLVFIIIIGKNAKFIATFPSNTLSPFLQSLAHKFQLSSPIFNYAAKIIIGGGDHSLPPEVQHSTFLLMQYSIS